MQNCYNCGKTILKKLSKNINYRKIRDHCHCAGKYRGVIHSICNLKLNMSNELPLWIFFTMIIILIIILSFCSENFKQRRALANWV